MFLTFAPLYGLVLIANLAPAGQVWRVLALVLTAGVNALLVSGGILLALSSVIGNDTALTAFPAGADVGSAGVLFAITGIIAFLLMVQRVQVWLYPRLRWELNPESTLHTIAVQLALWAIGGNLGSILLTRTVSAETLAGRIDSLSLIAIWEQGAIFVFIALLGVGLGLRRSWGETRERLGLGGLSAIQLLILPAIIIGLVLLQFGISALWLFDESTMSIAGAITIGFAAGIGEEVLMRGAVQPRFGIVFTTLLFTVLHTQYELSFATLIVLILSVVLGLVRRYFNTTACILVHAGYNSLLVLISLAAQSFMGSS